MFLRRRLSFENYYYETKIATTKPYDTVPNQAETRISTPSHADSQTGSRLTRTSPKFDQTLEKSGGRGGSPQGGGGIRTALELELRHLGLAVEEVEDVGGGADGGDAAGHDVEVRAQLLVRRLLARLPGERA